MKTYIMAYAATAFVFLGFDAIWLSVMGTAFYRPLLSGIMLENFRIAPAAIFYLLYVVGIEIFAVVPAFNTGHWTTALVYGALFGFFAYATYDLSNQATLKSWPTILTIVDLSWGTAVTGTSATLGYLFVSRVLKLIAS